MTLPVFLWLFFYKIYTLELPNIAQTVYGFKKNRMPKMFPRSKSQLGE